MGIYACVGGRWSGMHNQQCVQLHATGRPSIRIWPIWLSSRHVSTGVRIVPQASGIRTANDGARAVDKAKPRKAHVARARNVAFNPQAMCLHRAGTVGVAHCISTNMSATCVLVLGCATACSLAHRFRSGCGRIAWAQGPAQQRRSTWPPHPPGCADRGCTGRRLRTHVYCGAWK